LQVLELCRGRWRYHSVAVRLLRYRKRYMFEIIDSSQVPALNRSAPLPPIPIAELQVGKAIRVPVDHLTDPDARKIYGTIRTRVCRARAATGNEYTVAWSDGAIYVARTE
jgi:hypothetical protein